MSRISVASLSPALVISRVWHQFTQSQPGRVTNYSLSIEKWLENHWGDGKNNWSQLLGGGRKLIYWWRVWWYMYRGQKIDCKNPFYLCHHVSPKNWTQVVRFVFYPLGKLAGLDLILFIWMFWVHVFTMLCLVPLETQRDKVSDPLELRLQTVVDCHVAAENPISVLQCSSWAISPAPKLHFLLACCSFG